MRKRGIPDFTISQIKSNAEEAEIKIPPNREKAEFAKNRRKWYRLENQNAFIEWGNGADIEEEEMIEDYPLWEEEGDNQSSLDFSSALKFPLGEKEEEEKIRTSLRRETFLNRYEGSWGELARKVLVLLRHRIPKTIPYEPTIRPTRNNLKE